jgi:hypothetical protein
VISVFPLLLVLLSFSAVRGDTINYSPYPLATLPKFDPFIGLSITFLATPALLVDLIS